MKKVIPLSNNIIFLLSIILIVGSNARQEKNSVPVEYALQGNIPSQVLSATTTQDLLHSFLQPIQFTRSGMNNFFTVIFNSSLYAEQFLGSCFVHIIDFLEYGKKNGKPYSYYESVFLLFHHRLKENNWVNPYALGMFLDQIVDYIGYMPEQRHANLVDMLKRELETACNERALHALTNQMSPLKQQQTTNFYTQTAERLVAAVEKAEQESNIHDMQRSLIVLLESMLNKIIFSPKEHETLWKTVTVLAQKCEHLYNLGCIFGQDDLNRLLWSLLYRFGYFIECMGQHMPLSFYKGIRETLISDPVLFLYREEQEEWLTTKMDYLENILTKGEILAQAYKQGILTDVS